MQNDNPENQIVQIVGRELCEKLNKWQIAEFKKRVTHPLDWYNETFINQTYDHRYVLTLTFPRHFTYMICDNLHRMEIIRESWCDEMVQVADSIFAHYRSTWSNHSAPAYLISTKNMKSMNNAATHKYCKIRELLDQSKKSGDASKIYSTCRGIVSNPRASPHQLCMAVDSTPYASQTIFNIAIAPILSRREIMGIANNYRKARRELITIAEALELHTCDALVDMIMSYMFAHGPRPLVDLPPEPSKKS